ncbi:phosphatidylinositol 4-phosphate 5-kinase 10 isoform X1 [Rosa chinensis]|uniref:phosphatidylinositol 4-phosphate 5-kinase 10 isoform X1 n=1 Tax=Rosa chinensis TaxID=74649 RepID=UPI001AD8E7BA|nr:phosphatidylinositol 4-phosphate 5-kinase 10 isoform X1 [Rosa chinensis]XP_040365020.1 phosphatidylinositol 4-phosphate 5-kinase 10 isoform X1 [Rosa chinensis]
MEILKEELSPADFKATKSNRIRYSRNDFRQLPYFATDFEWKDYSPAVFRRILELDSIEYSDYQLSVCGDETLKEVTLSGKLGMVFLLSNDKRFILKTLRKSEVKIYLEMLPNYYDHLMKYGSSLLAKLYGLHVVRPAGGVKVYFVVFGNVIPSDICIFEHYDLKGSSKGRAENKVIIQERPVHKDMDFDFSFYLDPLVRDRLLAQIKTDCEFLESEGVMDYSLFLAIQMESPHQVSVDKRTSRRTDKEIIDDTSEGSDESSELTLADICDLLDRPGFRFGASLPARAVRAFKKEMGSSRSNRSRNSRAQSSAQECFNVLLFFGIVDICQNYNMRKRLEHACKSIKYDSKSIATVNPKAYSSRFQEFMSEVFLPEVSDDFSDSRVSGASSSNRVSAASSSKISVR